MLQIEFDVNNVTFDEDEFFDVMRELVVVHYTTECGQGRSSEVPRAETQTGLFSLTLKSPTYLVYPFSQQLLRIDPKVCRITMPYEKEKYTSTEQD